MKSLRNILIAFAFVVLSASVLNAQTSGSCGANGNNLTWQLTGTGDNLTLTISGAGAMADFSSSSTIPWYSQRANIKTLVLENGMTTIGFYAFYECSGLTSVTIPNSVTSIENWAFYACSGLTSINVDEGNTQYSSIDGVLFNKNQTTLIQYPAGKQGTSYIIPSSVTSIRYSAFEGCSDLTSVTIPSSVTSIGNQAFIGCSGLTSINVDEGNTQYSSIDGVLFNKNQTTLITYPAGKQGSYIIPSSVTSIENYAFYECSGLTSVTIPNSVTYIGNSTFEGCSGLTSVTIPSSITSIGTSAFCYCSGLTSVTIPNSVTTIGYYAFAYCSGLTSVIIPNSVTSIGDYAFDYCSGLTSVTIPNSVTHIGYWVFRNCSDLTDVYVSWATPLAISNSVFNGLTLSNITLHVPCSSSGLYAAAPVWRDFNISELSSSTITATAGSNGAISDEGITNVSCGGSKTYTFTVNSGYEIDTVLIDDVPNATAKENGYHTFENVTANHTISVTFKATVGIADIPANSISIYPNPTQNQLTIDGRDLQINRVEICDLAGRVVFGQPQGSPLQINVSALPAGIYLVKIHTDKGVVTRKVVVSD